MKLAWEKFDTSPMVLYARLAYDHGAITPTGLREEHLLPVQAWCEQNRCGIRTSFDMFRFRNEKEMSIFLLRWG